MELRKRIGCFETNSSSAHTVTVKGKFDFNGKIPDEIIIGRARFDYCGDTVKGYQNKANYLWEIITQSTGNYIWAMRFITYLRQEGIFVSFDDDWIENENWIDGELPYDDEGQELLRSYLKNRYDLMNFLFDDNLVVELYEG